MRHTLQGIIGLSFALFLASFPHAAQADLTRKVAQAYGIPMHTIT